MYTNTETENLTAAPAVMMPESESEPEIIINMDARTITVPEELYNIGVIGDHKCEKIFLRIPGTTFDGQTLTDKSPKIRYINAGREYGEFEITEIEIEDDTIRLGWMIDNFVTKYSGEVSFVLHFDLTDNNGLTYQWSTQPGRLNVLKGLDMDNIVISNKDKTIYQQLLRRVQNYELRINNIENALKKADIASLNNNYVQLKEDVVYLKNNVVYISPEI